MVGPQGLQVSAGPLLGELPQLHGGESAGCGQSGGGEGLLQGGHGRLLQGGTERQKESE